MELCRQRMQKGDSAVPDRATTIFSFEGNPADFTSGKLTAKPKLGPLDGIVSVGPHNFLSVLDSMAIGMGVAKHVPYVAVLPYVELHRALRLEFPDDFDTQRFADFRLRTDLYDEAAVLGTDLVSLWKKYSTRLDPVWERHFSVRSGRLWQTAERPRPSERLIWLGRSSAS
jgi:hypothetical protein